MIARSLSRTHAELMDPDTGISLRELTDWKALLMVEAEERADQARLQQKPDLRTMRG